MLTYRLNSVTYRMRGETLSNKSLESVVMQNFKNTVLVMAGLKIMFLYVFMTLVIIRYGVYKEMTAINISIFT